MKHLKRLKLNELHQDTIDSAKSKTLGDDKDLSDSIKKYPNIMKGGKKNYKIDENGDVRGIVKIDIGDIINCDFEEFLDLLSLRLIGNEMLTDHQYEVIGHEGNTIIFEVNGTIYEYEDEEYEDDDWMDDNTHLRDEDWD